MGYLSPPWFYIDYDYVRADCREVLVWTEKAQKWWEEFAKGPLYSRTVRCRARREAREADRGGMPRKSLLGRRLAESSVPDADPSAAEIPAADDRISAIDRS